MKIITNIFVSLFYSGYIKIIPGTFASFISILILFPFVGLYSVSYEILIIVFCLLFMASIFFISRFSYDSKTHDSKIIVIDEFLGIYLIFIFYDYIYFINSLITVCLIFILFRTFDILKVYPANIIDKKMQNSFGVILDDCIASIYTILIMYLLNVIS